MVMVVGYTKSKACKTCGEEKPLGEFSGCGVTPDRLQPNCKPCHEERKRAGFAAAREKRAEGVARSEQEVEAANEARVEVMQPKGGEDSAAGPENPTQSRPRADSPACGVVTVEVVQTEILRWQMGNRSVPIAELGREELLAAVRSLLDANANLRGEFERELGQVVDAHEQHIRSLHHVLAAQVELGFREAVRDKMDVILGAVMKEVELRSTADDESREGTNRNNGRDEL